MRSLSISATLSAATSATRRASAIGDREGRLMLQAGGRVSSRATSSRLSTTGRLRGVRHPDQLARQVRPVDRVRKEETATPRTMLFMVGVGMPGIALFDLEAAHVLCCRRIG